MTLMNVQMAVILLAFLSLMYICIYALHMYM